MKSKVVIPAIVVTALACLAVLVYCLFHGFFDEGSFQVLRTSRSGSDIAMIARRIDTQALGGYQVFVLVADHVYSSRELRHAYYYDELLFRAGSDCLTVEWIAPKELSIGCEEQLISPSAIAVEKKQQKDITITYINIPEKHR